MCSGLISTETNQKTSKTTGLERDTLNDAYPPGMPMHSFGIVSKSTDVVRPPMNSLSREYSFNWRNCCP